VRWVTLLGICTPPFWLGFLLLIAFAVKTPVFSVLPAPGIRGHILPSLALALPILCSGIRILRGSLLSEAQRDYVTYLKARGHSPREVLYRHMLPNALPPIVTLFCQYLGYLIAGSAVVESVFSIRGIGNYLVNCILAADSTAVAACVLIVAAVFVVANLMGDLLNRMICPWMVRETND
jgi:peptide/nickel transport system permease protein/nickel transport system permease protein